jgi:hypothetical protein
MLFNRVRCIRSLDNVTFVCTKDSREKNSKAPNVNIGLKHLARHIASQAESRPFVTDLDRMADLPREVRAIYFLWMFACEVGGNGIECFILQQQGLFTPQIHEALQLIGARELIERLKRQSPTRSQGKVNLFSALIWPGSRSFVKSKVCFASSRGYRDLEIRARRSFPAVQRLH